MARPKNKEELIVAANQNFEKLLTLISNRTENEIHMCYQFPETANRTQAHKKMYTK